MLGSPTGPASLNGPPELLTIDLAVAILLVKLGVGLIAPADQPGTGYELDLALIVCFLVVLFAGPGAASTDRALGLDDKTAETARS